MKKTHTVQSLRQSGHKVRVIHSRYLADQVNHPKQFGGIKNIQLFTQHELKQNGYTKVVSARGGKTFVQVTTPDGRELFAETLCSTKDNFSRKLGVQIALGRLNLE